MFCPKCRDEYVDTVAVCAHCEVDLVDAIPDDDVFASPESMSKALQGKDLEALFVGNHVALQDAQRNLAEQQFASVIAGEAADEIEPGMHARFFLMVRASELDAIRRYVQGQWDEGLVSEGLMLKQNTDVAAVEGGCPACGTEMPGDAAECPECGLFLGNPDAVE
ncbi:MAG: hypothetical protein V3T05_05860 [Myxococcota bacterium]